MARIGWLRWGLPVVLVWAISGCQQNEALTYQPIGAGPGPAGLGPPTRGGFPDAGMAVGSAPGGGEGSAGGGAANTGSGAGGSAAGVPDAGAPSESAGQDAASPPELQPGGADSAAPDASPPNDGGVPVFLPPGYRGTPWNGTPATIPGIVQAELFDIGGEGVAFHDTDDVNRGNGVQNAALTSPEATFRRNEAVDLSFMSAVDRTIGGAPEAANQLYVGWIQPGEWLSFTVRVTEAGTFAVGVHCAAPGDGAQLALEIADGRNLGPFVLPRTGSYRAWEHWATSTLSLAAGVHLITVRFPTAGANLNYLSFTRVP
jgi:hypothetical protein